MEEAARRFARNVLIGHLLLLAVVVAVVIFAAREVYTSAHEQAMEQARTRQEQLVSTTASGIHTYYSAILNNLHLLRRAEEQESTDRHPDPAERRPDTPERHPSPPSRLAGLRASAFAPILWNQISDRASHLIAVDRLELPLRIVESFARENSVSADQIIKDNAEWLRAVEQVAVSPVVQVGQHRANLLASPVPARRGLLLVAVIPIEGIEKAFLDKLNSPDTAVSAMLLDDAATIMVHHDHRLVGINVHKLSDPQLPRLADKYLASGEAGNEIFYKPVVLIDDPNPDKRVTLKPGLTRIQPVMVDGQTWWLVVSSGLAEVDQVVHKTFQRAMWWSLFVILAMTTILVSTSIQLIRGRSRLERVRHELLAKEINQAREIQLAWLPAQFKSAKAIDIAAINHPAQHISGDFYNWFELPDGRLVVAIGDVTGHGMAAAFLMATTQLLVRTTMMRLGDPGQALEEINHQLCLQTFNGQFVTLLIVVVDNQRGEMEVATAGHYPPLMGVTNAPGSSGAGAGAGEGAGFASGFASVKLEPQLVLGVEPDTPYVTERFDLPPGAAVLLYTDGVLDVVAPNGERFHGENLVKSLSAADHFESAQAIIDRVVQAVTAFRGSRDLPDDLTMVAIQLQSTPATPEPEMATA